MILTRRRLVEVGGVALATLVARGTKSAEARSVVGIDMKGRADGSHVWFDPIGLHILPGDTVRWTNGDAGNSHTATAYHPTFFDRPMRIPADAEPWDSDYLLPEESFSVTFGAEGVYDYYCVPHEHAGMVGRIVVGRPASPKYDVGRGPAALPEAALAGFPSVEEILEKGMVRPG